MYVIAHIHNCEAELNNKHTTSATWYLFRYNHNLINEYTTHIRIRRHKNPSNLKGQYYVDPWFWLYLRLANHCCWPFLLQKNRIDLCMLHIWFRRLTCLRRYILVTTMMWLMSPKNNRWRGRTSHDMEEHTTK